MTAIDNAKLAIDANFDINGVDAVYYSAYPGTGIPCRAVPDQADVQFGLEQARIVQTKAIFTLRGYAEGITPVQGAVIQVGGILHRIDEAPSPDSLRLLWRLSCVKK